MANHCLKDPTITLLRRPITQRRLNHCAYLFWKLQCHLAKQLLKHTGEQARLRRKKAN